MTITWKGREISSVKQNQKSETFVLIGPDGVVVDEVPDIVYRANSDLRRLPYGKHRRTASAHNSGANNQSSGAGGNGAYGISPAASALRPGGVTFVKTGLPLAHWRIFNEPPKPPLRRDGFVAGEIIGYRCWRIENGLLCSVYQDDIWRPSEVLEGRELEDWDQRGVHAWKDAASKEYHHYIRAYLNQDSIHDIFIILGRAEARRLAQPAMATGSVFLWGDVVEHTRGYRAEFARVRSIDWLYPDETMMGREPEVLQNLRGRYHV